MKVSTKEKEQIPSRDKFSDFEGKYYGRDTDTVADMKTSIRAESLPHLYHRPNLS